MRKNLVIFAILACGFIGGLVVSGRISGTQPAAATPPQQARPTSFPAATTTAAALPDLSAIADRAIQASVNISSTKMVRVDPFFQLFYGADPVQPQTSLGSGVLVTPDGYVLTNSHVVGAGTDIRVTLADKRDLAATVVGSDPVTDLALLKVNATGLSTLPWGDSSKLRVAEWVLAVGNPFAFSQTVTLGIVSSANRSDPQLNVYNDFIQTDAAINPGNSGGALVNSRGELVGINSMIYSQTGGYQGIGFAIPANLARSIMTELKDTGEIVRGSIGALDLRTADADLAKRAGSNVSAGVMILNMYRNEPAYRAGLTPYDIIVGVNGQAVTEKTQLERLIASLKVGSTARVEFVRRGDRRTIEIPVVRMGRPGRRF
jgi:S1-C subfamily serine protease